MLRQLVINDLAVIHKLNLDFESGMTVLTGETGAGKSILLDALGLILGTRADTTLIRGGKDKTEVTAIFWIKQNLAVQSLLTTSAIEFDEELFIRRVIRRDGPSRAYLNDTPVPVQTLRAIGEHLIDIHGQHEHQSLSRPAIQRTLLDQTGDYETLLTKTATSYDALKTIRATLTNINANDDYETRLSFLKYQIDELTEFNLGEMEHAELTEEHKRLVHSQQLLETSQKILTGLSESEQAIQSHLASYQREIAELCQIDDRLKNIANLLDNATIQVNEASVELQHYLDQFDADPSQLNHLENRLNKLYDLARKHQVKPEQLYAQLALLTDQLQQLEGGQAQLAQLTKQHAQLTEQYYQHASDLHQQRKKTAQAVATAVTQKMQELGMGGQFKIDVEKLGGDVVQRDGTDKVTFLVSTNPGQPLRPISKVASGGELSRLSLAIQMIGTKDSGIPTLIFDEVDAGIGGRIAEVIGRMLHNLASHRQVLCVTHLAQVAATAHHHLQINKTIAEDETYTQVSHLDQASRIDEIARMLAGATITNESRANAKKMLDIE